MKIAITAVEKSMESNVDPRFGRASYILVYDTETNSSEFVDNIKNLNAAKGAGIQTAQNVAATGAKVVITGNCGPNAFKTLNAADIEVAIGINGTLKDAINKFNKGELKYSTDANVEGHWG